MIMRPDRSRGVLFAIIAIMVIAALLPVPLWLSAKAQDESDPARPNIIMLVAEDLSPRLGSYDDPAAQTPNINRLASEGIRFTSVFTTAGVCAPSRSALITGMHQQSLGTMHMRTSSYGTDMDEGFPYEAVPPPYVKAFPELLRQAGYYTINRAKTDYQFGNPFTIWDENGGRASWLNREPGQPFFAMINFNETHESYTWLPDGERDGTYKDNVRDRNASIDTLKTVLTDPADVVIPPYYPQTDLVAQNMARQYDNAALVDRLIGDFIDTLEADGLLDNSIVIFTTDHGDGLPRAKRTLYDTGIAVPLIVRFPDGSGAGTVRTDLISFVDLAPTILSMAGSESPAWMQGHSIIGDRGDSPREFVFAAADRLDERPGRIKAARNAGYKYIRNYRPDLPRLPSLDYQNENPIMQQWRAAWQAGELSPVQSAYFRTPSPVEELYDLRNDPYEIDNLADDPAAFDILETMRAAMDRWIDRTGDLSAMPEADMVEAMWPGGTQPETLPPSACLANGQLHLASATARASIGYRTGESDRWLLYSGPIETEGAIETKAIRYGYSESTAVRIVPSEIASCT